MTDSRWVLRGLMTLIGLTLCALALWKAKSMGFTHDEAYTYNHYLDDTFMEVVSFNMWPLMANNHIINSLWMRLADALCGPDELSLRGLSLAMLPLYLLTMAQVSLRARGILLPLASFVLLSTNQMVFEYFSLARGYATGCTLLIFGMVLRMSVPLEGPKGERLRFLALMIAGAGAFAQFSVLTAFLAFVLADGLIIMPDRASAIRWRKLWPNAMATAIWAVILYEPVRATVRFELAFGSGDSFFNSSIVTLVSRSLNGTGASTDIIGLLGYGIMAFLVIASAKVLWAARSMSPSHLRNDPLIVCLIVPLLAVIGNLVQVRLFHGYYLEGRSALVYVPLFILFNVMLTQRAQKSDSRMGQVATPVMTLFAVLSLLVFSVGYSPTASYEWHFDRGTREVAKWLSDCGSGHPDGSVRVASMFYFEPALNFYRTKLGAVALAPVTRIDSIPTDADFVVWPTSDLGRLDTQKSDCEVTFTEGEVCVLRVGKGL